MDGKKTNRRDLYIAAAILLSGAIISLLILTGVFSGKGRTAPSGEPAAQYTVTFYDSDGKELSRQDAQSGGFVLPPEISKPNCVFKGWSQKLYNIGSDMDVYPVFEAFDGDTKNVVCGGDVYAERTGPVIVPVRLEGQVGCSGFTIEIEYDSSLLKYEKAERTASGVSVTDDKTRGVLTLSYSGEALNSPLELAALTFSCLRKGGWETELKTATKEIVTLRGEETVYTDSVAYDTEITLFE